MIRAANELAKFGFVSRSVSEDEPVFNFYMSSIFPYITPVIYPVRASRVFTAAVMRCYVLFSVLQVDIY